MSVLNPHMHAWSPHNAVLVTSFHLKIVSCTPFRQVSKAWTSILEMSRFVRSLVTNAFLCLAFKLCDGSQSILHDHQQIVHTMDVQVFYYCNILIRRYVGEAWQPRASSCRGMHARIPKSKGTPRDHLEQPHTDSGRRRFTSSLDETRSSIQARRT